MQSEYTGSRLLLRWHEVRARGFATSWWRLRYEIRKKLGWAAKAHGPDLSDPESILSEFDTPLSSVDDLLGYFRDGGRGRFVTDRAPLNEYADAVRATCDADATIAAAEEILNHRFEFLGQKFDFGGREIDWHCDPPSGSSWPQIPWAQIDIRTDRRLGDVKFVWELNRCQFWPTLGRAYALTGDERYAAEWVSQFNSWCEQNPSEIGVNWWSNLEHALRIVSWWSSAKLMLHSEHVTGELLARLTGLLVAKARHILADLDYSIVNMANNHLIGDAMGVAVLAMAIPELKESDEWLDLAWPILEHEAPKQIYPDGSSFECAVSYHRFVLHFYLLAIIMADLNGRRVSDVVRCRVEGMAEFVQAAMGADGRLPGYGDWDDGLGYCFNDAPVQDFRPVLSTAAVLFGRGDFAASAGSIDQETIWLLGPDAVAAFDALAREASPEGNIAFPDGGYFFQRRAADGVRLFIPNTPFTSHTHADCLSVDLQLDGRPVLVDAGNYTYNGDWDWRTWFRGSAAHNTLTVDGRGQALAHRQFRWLFEPRATNNFFAGEGRFCFDGAHDGYRCFGLTHRRVVIEMARRTWLCLDVLEGSGRHDVDIRWLFAPDLSVDIVDNAAVAQRDGASVLTIATAASAPMTADVCRGRTDPAGGWYSDGYGVKEPTSQVTFSASGASTPLVSATVLGGGDLIQPVSVERDGAAVRVKLQSPDGDMDVEYQLLDPSRCRDGRVELGFIRRVDGSIDSLNAERVGG